MSAAAAKRRKREPEDDLNREKGLWVDPSRLPNAKQIAHSKLPPEQASYSRFLELADIALGNPKSLPKLSVERRKNTGKKFKGTERRKSSR